MIRPRTHPCIRAYTRQRPRERADKSPRSVLSHLGGHTGLPCLMPCRSSADCTSGIAILRCVLSLTSAASPALPLAAHHHHLPHAMPGADVRVTSQRRALHGMDRRGQRRSRFCRFCDRLARLLVCQHPYRHRLHPDRRGRLVRPPARVEASGVQGDDVDALAHHRSWARCEDAGWRARRECKNRQRQRREGKGHTHTGPPMTRADRGGKGLAFAEAIGFCQYRPTFTDWDGTAPTLTTLEICPFCARLLHSPQCLTPSIVKNVPHRTQHSRSRSCPKQRGNHTRNRALNNGQSAPASLALIQAGRIASPLYRPCL